MIAVSALATDPQVSNDYATQLFRVRGMALPGSYASRQSSRPTIALYKSGQGIGKSTPAAAKQETKHQSSAVTTQPDIFTVKGLSKPGARY